MVSKEASVLFLDKMLFSIALHISTVFPHFVHHCSVFLLVKSLSLTGKSSMKLLCWWEYYWNFRSGANTCMNGGKFEMGVCIFRHIYQVVIVHDQTVNSSCVVS